MGKHVDDLQFVEFFLGADDINQVSLKFNMSHAAAYTKASRLRKAGVDLPRLRRKPLDVNELNAVIEHEVGTL